nr:hypothetical protein MFLOJ_12200 [Mycobacterium florentinum]
MQDVGELTRLGDVTRNQGESEFGDQLLICGVPVAHYLTTELDDAAVVERNLLDTSAHSAAGLENDNVGAGPHQVAGSGQAG